MTRCRKKEVNLKSSPYNQTGQNYFERLSAYNSMSSHLRRILLARSAVDARNKNYVFTKNRYCKAIVNKDAYLDPEVANDVIDRLAYDTRHHPMDILRMNLNSKDLHSYDRNSEGRRRKICISRARYENNQRNSRQRSTSRSQGTTSRTMTYSPKRKESTMASNFACKKEFRYTREIPRIIDQSICRSRRRCEKDPCATAALDSSICKSVSCSPIQETSDHRSVSSSASQSYDDSDYDDKYIQQLASKQLSSQKEEEKKYVKFVYDITKEIMQSGLYIDKELQDVFKRHIDKNKGILNMNKMLYEIYQLKISLNILDDSDTDDELDDLIHAQKLLSISEIRPPTPPKILDENKVMEKLKSYQELMEGQCKPSGVNKSVVLVDANPELLVTERDVLISLMEVGIDPKQAQHICKSLHHKSRDTFLAEKVQAGAKAYAPNVQPENVKLRDIDKEICGEVRTNKSGRNSVANNSIDFTEKREAPPSTSNLVTIPNDIVETKEKIDSQSPLDKHNIGS